MARRTLASAYRNTALCKRQKDSADAVVIIVRIFFVNLSYFDQKQLPRFWFASRLQRAVVPGFTDFHNPAHGMNAELLSAGARSQKAARHGEGMISECLSFLPPLRQRVVQNTQLCRRLLHADFIGQLDRFFFELLVIFAHCKHHLVLPFYHIWVFAFCTSMISLHRVFRRRVAGLQ